MAEVTLLDAFAPFLRIVGGLAGMSIAYMVVQLYYRRRELRVIEEVRRQNGVVIQQNTAILRRITRGR